MLINIYLGTMGCKWTGDELQASENFLMTSNIFFRKKSFFKYISIIYRQRGNCMLINIYLGTMGCKWTGDELQASEDFLMTSNIFFRKKSFFKYISIIYRQRGNCMLINIYLGTMGCKWTGDELQASEDFLMTSNIFFRKKSFFKYISIIYRQRGNCMLINIYLGTMGCKWTGDELQASENFLMTSNIFFRKKSFFKYISIIYRQRGNCMLINIYLGTMGCKWTGDELQASEDFLMTSNIFFRKKSFFKYISIIYRQRGNCMLINIYLGTMGCKWTGDELQASENFLMTSNIFFRKKSFFKYISIIYRQRGNCMLINIYLGTMGCKWTGDELQASEDFLMTSNIFFRKKSFFKYISIIYRQRGNCMLINIYLGTMGCKWTGDELQASEDFLMTSNIFFQEKVIF